MDALELLPLELKSSRDEQTPSETAKMRNDRNQRSSVHVERLMGGRHEGILQKEAMVTE